MTRARLSFLALAAVLAACGGGGGGAGAPLQASSHPIDPALVGTYHSTEWEYDYADGTSASDVTSPANPWTLELRADGSYHLHKERVIDHQTLLFIRDGRWGVGPSADSTADGTLFLALDSSPCDEPFTYRFDVENGVPALYYWQNDGPRCTVERGYTFYDVEWARDP